MKKKDITLEMIQQALLEAHRTYSTSDSPYSYSARFYGARPAAIVEELREISQRRELGPVPKLSRDDFAKMGFTILRARRLKVGVRYRIFGGVETDVVVLGRDGDDDVIEQWPSAAAWARWQKEIAG